MIPYGRQDINQADIDAVINVLKSDFLTQGPMVPKFEDAIKRYVNAEFALAVNSATSALHIACLALGVTKGDWVWTSPITFVASANCALYCGAKVDFVDIDPDTLNLCPKELAKKLEIAKQESRLPKVIIPVHMAGQSCEMKEIHKLCSEYGVKVIEDASHSIGASFEDTKVGSCKYSDITIFSFHPVKIITTAEGGVATTSNQELYQKMDLLRSHGVTRDPKLMTHEPDGPWYYQQVELGFNYRITEMQAALGLSQMERLDEFVAKRNELAKIYDEKLKGLPLKIFTPRQGIHSSYHLYIIQLENQSKRLEVFKKLREADVGVNLHYIPVTQQPYYKKLNYAHQFNTPNADEYYKSAISIPLYYNLNIKSLFYIEDCLKESLEG